MGLPGHKPWASCSGVAFRHAPANDQTSPDGGFWWWHGRAPVHPQAQPNRGTVPEPARWWDGAAPGGPSTGWLEGKACSADPSSLLLFSSSLLRPRAGQNLSQHCPLTLTASLTSLWASWGLRAHLTPPCSPSLRVQRGFLNQGSTQNLCLWARIRGTSKWQSSSTGALWLSSLALHLPAAGGPGFCQQPCSVRGTVRCVNEIDHSQAATRKRQAWFSSHLKSHLKIYLDGAWRNGSPCRIPTGLLKSLLWKSHTSRQVEMHFLYNRLISPPLLGSLWSSWKPGEATQVCGWGMLQNSSASTNSTLAEEDQWGRGEGQTWSLS